MAYIVRLPGLGMQQDRATLVEWHVAIDDEVEEDQVIAEIETEKTTVEIEAREDGVLRRIYVEEGDVATPNDPVAIIAGPDEDISDLQARIDESEIGIEEAEEEPAESAGAGAGGDAGETAASGGGSSAPSGDRRITPRARKRAEELDVDLSAVEGTGPEGAVTADDVEAAAGSGDEEEARITPRARRRAEELGIDPSGIDGSGPGGAVTEDDVEAAAGGRGAKRTLREERTFSPMRETIAERLSESYREAVHVTVNREVDAEELLATADAAGDALGADIAMPDVLLVALSSTLAEHPEFNATFEEGTHRLYEEHNVGIAVDVDRGLITPVLEDVGGKSIEEIAEERREITERALADEFTMADLRGGTFTVSNLGPMGVESFDPIINPPEIAILGVNAVVERAVDEDGSVAFRRRLPLSLSFDHRVVDGADAARFLDTLAGHLEDPWGLLPEGVERREGGGDVTLPGRSVTARTGGGVSGTVTAGSFEWAFDEPGDLGGSGGAPTPVDIYLGGLSACLSASIGFQAEKREVDLEAVEVAVDASPEHGFLESIDVAVTLDPVDDAVETEALERIVELGERGCYVADLLREDFDLSLSWERA